MTLKAQGKILFEERIERNIIKVLNVITSIANQNCKCSYLNVKGNGKGLKYMERNISD